MNTIADSSPPITNSCHVIKKKTCKPRFETALRKETVLYVGRRGELAVEIHGVPPPAVKWAFNGVLLRDDSHVRHEWSHDGWYKLIIDDVTHKDGGDYKVIACNDHGERDSRTTVHVEAGPPIISSLCKTDIKLKTGEKLCIVVSIKDYGKDYDVIWFKNLLPIPDDDEDVKITKKRHLCSLKIDSVDVNVTGQYKCVVSSVGETSIKFNVEVIEETRETDEEEEGCCHGNTVILNKSLCNRSASLDDLLEKPSVQSEVRKASLDSTERHLNTKKEVDDEGHGKESDFPDIYTSLTPSSKRNALGSKTIFSCMRLKAFFRESLHFSKNKSNRIYKSKSFSEFPDGGDENVAPSKVTSQPDSTTSAKMRSVSLPDLIDESDINDNTVKPSPHTTGTHTPINNATSRRSRSLVHTMKHSISRRFGRTKSFVEPEDKHTPPKLIKFSKNHICRNNEITSKSEEENEDELNITRLTREDKEKMGRSLHVLISGSLKWQLLTARMCERGLINIDQKEIEICKYPQRLNIGRKLVESIVTCKPDLTVDEFRSVAKKRNREDIFVLLAPFTRLKLVDVPRVERQKLEISCSLQTNLSGYTWKLLAQDIGVSEECINSIEETLYSTSSDSSLDEIFKIFLMRNPTMSLKSIVGTLRELHFNDSANTLEYIIKEKREQMTS